MSGATSGSGLRLGGGGNTVPYPSSGPNPYGHPGNYNNYGQGPRPGGPVFNAPPQGGYQNNQRWSGMPPYQQQQPQQPYNTPFRMGGPPINTPPTPTPGYTPSRPYVASPEHSEPKPQPSQHSQSNPHQQSQPHPTQSQHHPQQVQPQHPQSQPIQMPEAQKAVVTKQPDGTLGEIFEIQISGKEISKQERGLLLVDSTSTDKITTVQVSSLSRELLFTGPIIRFPRSGDMIRLVVDSNPEIYVDFKISECNHSNPIGSAFKVTFVRGSSELPKKGPVYFKIIPLHSESHPEPVVTLAPPEVNCNLINNLMIESNHIIDLQVDFCHSKNQRVNQVFITGGGKLSDLRPEGNLMEITTTVPLSGKCVLYGQGLITHNDKKLPLVVSGSIQGTNLTISVINSTPDDDKWRGDFTFTSTGIWFD